VRVRTGAQIGITNGGGIRRDLPKGRITNGDVLTTLPFQNNICVIEATGQQILDALEWGVHALPDEFGGFLHVSGLTYEIDTRISSGCKTDSSKLLTGIEGERRVRNVKVGDEPLDPQKTYTVAGSEYTLLEKGDGQTAFDGCNKIQGGLLDSQVLIDYVREDLKGKIGDTYADPYGQGRIKIIDEED
jgi:2',3'-cyclic-nucleotide 2'-phosphodiesterase (5'-nucleotidase family)